MAIVTVCAAKLGALNVVALLNGSGGVVLAFLASNGQAVPAADLGDVKLHYEHGTFKIS
jgi:hypothetical protein